MRDDRVEIRNKTSMTFPMSRLDVFYNYIDGLDKQYRKYKVRKTKDGMIVETKSLTYRDIHPKQEVKL